MKTVQVEYVGLKDEETDHLYGTGITWTGKGDVHAVPASAWEGMSKHPDVWRLVGDGESTQAAAPTASKSEGLASVNASKNEAVKTPTASKSEGQGEGGGDGKGSGGSGGDGLEAMTLDQLRELCTARNIDFHPNAKEANLIAKLRA